MNRIVLVFVLVFFSFSGISQEIYKATSGEISFFSKTPVEDINASNKLVKALINTQTGEVVFITTIVGFKFKKPLMEEHFNENYMESDKFKTAMFKGRISGEVNYAEEGEYDVKAVGTLNIHGVDQEREIEGKIIVKEGQLKLNSDFGVKLVDHDIEVPKLVVKKIAEVVQVNVNVSFEKKQ